jgi:pimeloyl-ACP methyl ester carboxylesterase
VRRRLLLIVSAAVLLAATPASAAPPRPKADPPTPTIPQRYLDQPIEWSVCSFDGTVKALHPGAPTTHCATIDAPMDWTAPDAHPNVQIAIAYSRATGSSRGLMMSNPGGPGGAGRTLSAALAIDKPRLFQDYDLVGFDPRGFGNSTRLQCLTTPEDLAALPITPDYRRRDDRTHEAEIAAAKLLAEACDATEFGRFVSSQQTVYDMELVRALLGNSSLSFIGYSYGTWLGGWYADTYPTRVDRFVLDSNMDWANTQWDNVNFDPFSFQRRRDTQLFPWIARHAAEIDGLGASAEAVLATYEDIRARLVSLAEGGGSSVRGDGLDGGVAGAIYGNRRFVEATLHILVHDEYADAPGSGGGIESAHVERAWARLGPGLRAFDSLAAVKARYGVDSPARTTGELLARARADAEGAPADAQINLGSFGTTVRCNDTAWKQDVDFYLSHADRNTRAYPFLGYLNGVPMCAFWPHAPQHRVLDLAGSPQLLMVSAELDPATAYEGALRTHLATHPATRLVSIDDEGQHGQYVGSYSSCAEEIGDAFVFEGALPAVDVACDTSPLPGDSSVFAVDGPLDGYAVRLQGPRTSVRPQKPNPLLERILERTETFLR